MMSTGRLTTYTSSVGSRGGHHFIIFFVGTTPTFGSGLGLCLSIASEGVHEGRLHCLLMVVFMKILRVDKLTTRFVGRMMRRKN